MAWYGALGVLGALAALFPWELGEKADPFVSAPAGIRPEWYFLAPFYTLKLIPSHVWFFEGELLGLFGFGVLALCWITIPFWGTKRDGQDRTRWAIALGCLAIALPDQLFTFGVFPMNALRYGLMILFCSWLMTLAQNLEAKDSCVECHAALEDNLQAPAVAFPTDIHQHRGFSCVDCHGGDPNQDDPEASMSRAHGFVGKIKRVDVPKLCARCHSDANLIHKYKPQQRIDQYALYQTSVHGKRIAAGDTAAANCVDCHSVHDIREVKDPRSPVYPLRLPETCARLPCRCFPHEQVQDSHEPIRRLS